MVIQQRKGQQMEDKKGKETIYLMIDVYITDDGQDIFKIEDYYTHETPECTYGNGWYVNEYNLDDDIEIWKKEYNIIIKKDWR